MDETKVIASYNSFGPYKAAGADGIQTAVFVDTH